MARPASKFARALRLPLLCIAAACACPHAFAAVGMAVGAAEIAPDGMPKLHAGEQAQAFFCQAPFDPETGAGLTGPAAEACAVEKCKRAFPAKESKKQIKLPGKPQKPQKTPEHCVPFGYSEQPGWAIALAGPKGDNVHILSQILGEPDRQSALKALAEDGFPAEGAAVLFDFYDDGKNPGPARPPDAAPAAQGAAQPAKAPDSAPWTNGQGQGAPGAQKLEPAAAEAPRQSLPQPANPERLSNAPAAR